MIQVGLDTPARWCARHSHVSLCGRVCLPLRVLGLRPWELRQTTKQAPVVNLVYPGFWATFLGWNPGCGKSFLDLPNPRSLDRPGSSP